jgi:hypothetical protein
MGGMGGGGGDNSLFSSVSKTSSPFSNLSQHLKKKKSYNAQVNPRKGSWQIESK